MKVQLLEHADLDSLNELQPEGWPDITPAIRGYIESEFCFPIKVVADGKIVGLGTEIVHEEVSWLAHIIVHPQSRKQGIGKLITKSLVEGAQSRGCETIYLIATDLGEPIYKNAGFLTETEYVFFKDLRLDEAIHLTKNVLPYSEEFKQQAWNLDRDLSGEDRRKELEQHLSGSFLYLQDGLLTGLYLPTFGEGLIIAATEEAGIELMKKRLQTKENASFPIDNISAREFLYQNNFKEFKTAKRMRLGKKRTWKPEGLYNRIGGNLG